MYRAKNTAKAAVAIAAGDMTVETGARDTTGGTEAEVAKMPTFAKLVEQVTTGTDTHGSGGGGSDAAEGGGTVNAPPAKVAS